MIDDRPIKYGHFASGDSVEVSYVDLVWGPTVWAGTIIAFGELADIPLVGVKPTKSTPFAYVDPWQGSPEKGVQEVAISYLRKLSTLEALAWAAQ